MIRSHYIKGILAEYYVLFFLFIKGYKCLKHRYRGKSGEIDLIMRKKGVIIAVEVKYRKNHDDALCSIYKKQKQRIRSSLEVFVSNKSYTGLRCDVCVIGRNLKILHLKNAF